LKEHRLACCSA